MIGYLLYCVNSEKLSIPKKYQTWESKILSFLLPSSEKGLVGGNKRLKKKPFSTFWYNNVLGYKLKWPDFSVFWIKKIKYEIGLYESMVNEAWKVLSNFILYIKI